MRVGSGAPIDAATYIAWKEKPPLVLTPTALTVEARFTRAVVVRREGQIDYVGETFIPSGSSSTSM